MTDSESNPSFLGNGWSFPPEFVQNGRGLVMTSDEEDIRASLEILFSTMRGERTMVPNYGLDLHDLLFEPMSTTAKAFLKDRIATAILIDEPRIKIVSLDIESLDANGDSLQLRLDYEVRATNSRYNLVFPFYRQDGSEVARTIAGAGRPR